jgi:uncharacterized membrane protein YkvA (DUF1232 family)
MAIPRSARERVRQRSGETAETPPAGSAAGPGSRRERQMRGSPRMGAKRTVMSYIAELPRFVRLLWGLITDPRVALVDKLLVAGAMAYIVTPVDLIPDFIPFLGEVDDVFLLVVALRRLMQNAGRSVLLSHWTGDPADLIDLNLRKVLVAAAFFLPRRVRRRLRMMGRA